MSVVPPLQPLWADHLRENFGSALPHLFMGEIAEWFIVPNAGNVRVDDNRRTLCRALDRALLEGSIELREVVQVSFVENLPTTGSRWFSEWFGSALQADFERFSGTKGT